MASGDGPARMAVAELTGQTCETREYVGPIALHRSGRVDPARTRVRCAAHAVNGCDTVVLMAESVSYIACMATTGPGSGLGAFILQCGDEQHFCCSPECALVAHVYCMAHHVYPAVAALLAARQGGVLRAADVAHVTLTPASDDDADAARTIRQLRTRGQATARASARRHTANVTATQPAAITSARNSDHSNAAST